jgi:hypothetical protein
MTVSSWDFFRRHNLDTVQKTYSVLYDSAFGNVVQYKTLYSTYKCIRVLWVRCRGVQYEDASPCKMAIMEYCSFYCICLCDLTQSAFSKMKSVSRLTATSLYEWHECVSAISQNTGQWEVSWTFTGTVILPLNWHAKSNSHFQWDTVAGNLHLTAYHLLVAFSESSFDSTGIFPSDLLLSRPRVKRSSIETQTLSCVTCSIFTVQYSSLKQTNVIKRNTDCSNSYTAYWKGKEWELVITVKRGCHCQISVFSWRLIFCKFQITNCLTVPGAVLGHSAGQLYFLKLSTVRIV